MKLDSSGDSYQPPKASNNAPNQQPKVESLKETDLWGNDWQSQFSKIKLVLAEINSKDKLKKLGFSEINYQSLH